MRLALSMRAGEEGSCSSRPRVMASSPASADSIVTPRARHIIARNSLAFQVIAVKRQMRGNKVRPRVLGEEMVPLTSFLLGCEKTGNPLSLRLVEEIE